MPTKTTKPSLTKDELNDPERRKFPEYEGLEIFKINSEIDPDTYECTMIDGTIQKVPKSILK